MFEAVISHSAWQSNEMEDIVAADDATVSKLDWEQSREVLSKDVEWFATFRTDGSERLVRDVGVSIFIPPVITRSGFSFDFPVLLFWAGSRLGIEGLSASLQTGNPGVSSRSPPTLSANPGPLSDFGIDDVINLSGS